MEVPVGIRLKVDNLLSIRVKHRQTSLIWFVGAGIIHLYNRTNRADKNMPFDTGTCRDAGRTGNCQDKQE